MQTADYNKKYGQIIAKAWSEPLFKQRLLENPKSVSEEYGIPVPEGLELRVVENTPGVIHIVLPSKPAGDLLTDEQLEAIAGGIASTPEATTGSPPPAGTAIQATPHPDISW